MIEISEENDNRVVSMLIIRFWSTELIPWQNELPCYRNHHRSSPSSLRSRWSSLTSGYLGEEMVNCVLFKLQTTHRRGRRCSPQLQPSPQGFWTGHPRWHLPRLRCSGSVSTTQEDRPQPQGFPHTGSGWCSDSTPTLAALPDCTLSPKDTRYWMGTIKEYCLNSPVQGRWSWREQCRACHSSRPPSPTPPAPRCLPCCSCLRNN